MLEISASVGNGMLNALGDVIMEQDTVPAAASFGRIAQNTDATGRMMRDDAPPVPKRKPPLLTNADEGEVTQFVREQEAPITYLYKDNKGYMTVGVGHRITNLEKAKSLPFQVYENGKSLRPATMHEIEEHYNQVQAIPHGQSVSARQYSAEKNESMKDIRLPDEEVDRILKNDLRIKAQELRKTWKDFDKMPGDLQKAMTDVHFNTGNLTPKNWPKLNKAIENKDIEGIIREINRDTKHEERNKAVERLLKKMKVQN